MKNRLLWIIVLLVSLCSCSKNGWEETEEGALIFYKNDSFFGGHFSWNGDTLKMGVANGLGVLKYTDRINNDNNFEKKVIAYCGACEKPENINNYTVGYLNKKSKLDGFGVEVKDGKTIICNFDNGKAKGDGVIYKKLILEYEGELKNNSPHGSGTLYYDNGQIRYTGNFKNGEYSGKGVLFDSVGNKVYEGRFSQGLYDGYGVAYDSIGNATAHVWTKGGLDKPTIKFYNQLDSCKSKLTAQQQADIRIHILRWERYHLWMYIGWGLAAIIIILVSCVLCAMNNDINTRYNRSKPWNKYIIWAYYSFLGWLGVHRYALQSKLGMIYPVLVTLILIANIREVSVYLFYPSSWCMWTLGGFTFMCLLAIGLFLIFDFCWIPWRCYKWNHLFYRHDKNEDIILSHKQTSIMSFCLSVAQISKQQSDIISRALQTIKKVHVREFTGKKGFFTRIGRALSGDDPWLNFEKQRAREIQKAAKQAETAQNKYAELCEKLNDLLSESRTNAYRNFALAKELISVAIASKGKHQKIVTDATLDDKKLSIVTFIDDVSNIQTGIDWANTTDMAIKCTKGLLSMGIKGPWAIGIGVGVSLLSSALETVNAAQKACEDANRECAEAISQLQEVCDAITESQASILRAGEIIIALNKANEAFWQTYADLRNYVFGDEPSFKQFIFGPKIATSDKQNITFRESIMHLAQVCSEYNKINQSKIE